MQENKKGTGKKAWPILAASAIAAVAVVSSLTFAREQNAFRYPWEEREEAADSSNNPVCFTDETLAVSYDYTINGASSSHGGYKTVFFDSGDQGSGSSSTDGFRWKWERATNSLSWTADPAFPSFSLTHIRLLFGAKAWGFDKESFPTMPDGSLGYQATKAENGGFYYSVYHNAYKSDNEATPSGRRSFCVKFYGAFESFSIDKWLE